MNSNVKPTLANASAQAEARGLADVFIVDADAHHYEAESWAEVVEYIPDTVQRNFGRNPRPGRPSLMVPPLGTSDTGGRLRRDPPATTGGEVGGHADLVALHGVMESMAIDVALPVPTLMQFLGLHPQPEIELNLARAYNRWLVERIIPEDPMVRPYLYLPFNMPEACPSVIADFGDTPGAAGFVAGAARYRPVHDNAYMRSYAMLEERGLKLAFHAAHDWMERPTSDHNRFLGVYALGAVQFHMTHMTNWIVNGLPERFPGLDLIWMEGGLAWVPFLMQRLDSGFNMRPSEAPALKRPPSEYMREMYYTSHPIEATGEPENLEYIFNRINAPSQLMWASGYPQWNFDTPSALWDLDFLDETAKRNILGGTAKKLFGLG